jgi:hypothetical protein
MEISGGGGIAAIAAQTRAKIKPEFLVVVTAA